MCGISGFIGKHKNREEILESMMNKIIHRGPDSSGKYVSEDAAMGFRRLSIVDLDHGHQPMYNETKDIVITFNGEIYNFEALRNTLIEKGHVFENASDTEVLVHGYEEYDIDLLKHLRGMFSFIIWDEKKKRAFAARDFFGIKPFYYAQIDGCLVYASEIKSILEFPGYKREVNEDALEYYLSFQYSPLEETFFKGIYKLQPGHYMIYENGKATVKEFWRPMLEPEKDANYEECVKEIYDVTQASIQQHLTGDVEVASFLSSGVDSSYVAGTYGGKKTFTVGFLEDNGRYNEIPYAKRMADNMGLENYARELTADDFWNTLPTVMYHMDEPLADASAIALYFVNEEAAKQVKVCMSGEGADELFGGYNIYGEALSLNWFKAIPMPIRKFMGKAAEKLPNIKGKSYLIRGSKTLQERFIGNANIFTAKEKNALLKNPKHDRSPMDITSKFYKEAEHLDDVSKMQYIDMRLWLPGDILLKADKMSMAHSLEARVPFLDIEVFKTAKKLPINYRLDKGVTKKAFRDCTRRHLPPAIAEKKKLGFPVPIRVWMKQEQYYLRIRQAFQSRVAEQYFNTDQLIQLLHDHKNGKKDNSRKIWTVYMFLIWYDVYFQNKA